MYKIAVPFIFKNYLARRSLCCCFILFFISTITTTGFGQSPTTLPPAAQEAINKGIMAAKIPDYPLAITYFQNARKAAPQSSQIFFNLGLAESNIPGRELRAICWFGAFLLANPITPNKLAIKEQMLKLDVINQSNISRFLKTALVAAGQISGDKQSENLFKVVELLAKAGEFEDAKKTADLIQRMDFKSRALRAIVLAQATSRDFEGAKKTADLLKDSEPNQQWKSLALTDIAVWQARSGHIEEAQRTADLIQYAGLNGRWKSNILTAMAIAQVKAGNIDEAQKTTDLIHNDNWKSEALSRIALAQAKAGDFSRAQKTTDLIQDTIFKRSALTAIAVTQVKNGDTTGAQKTFASALMTADLILDTSNRRVAHTAIAEALIKCGDIKGAQRTLLVALATADLYKDTYRKSIAYARIAILQWKTGDITGAQKIIDLIDNAGWKSYAKAGIVLDDDVSDTPVHTTVADWLRILDDDYQKTVCPLSTEVFLDFNAVLRTLSLDNDPQKIFDSLQQTAGKVIGAQKIVQEMVNNMPK